MVPLSPTPNIGSSSSVLASGTMVPVAADELVADRTPVEGGGGICGDEVVDFNPTAENMAKYICDALAPQCYRVDVQESIDNIASYIKD